MREDNELREAWYKLITEMVDRNNRRYAEQLDIEIPKEDPTVQVRSNKWRTSN